MPIEANRTIYPKSTAILEEAMYRSLKWSDIGMIQDLNRVSADPFADMSACAPVIIQSKPAEEGTEVTARFLEPVAEPSMSWVGNLGKVTSELMRDHEGEAAYKIRTIPNWMWRAGRKTSNIFEFQAHAGIEPEAIVARQSVAQFAMGQSLAPFFSVLYGYSPNILRAGSANYSPYAHPNIFYGKDLGSSIGDLENSVTGDRPNKDLPAKIAHKCKQLNLRRVRVNGKVYAAVAFVDRDLFDYLYNALGERFSMVNAGAASVWFQDYEVGEWAKVLFIDHDMAPITPIDVTTLATVAGGAGDDTYTTLNFDDQTPLAIPQDIGGPTQFSYMFVLGGGAARVNYGSQLYNENDNPYKKYEMKTGQWHGRIMGMARGDRITAGGDTYVNDTSFLAILRRS